MTRIAFLSLASLAAVTFAAAGGAGSAAPTPTPAPIPTTPVPIPTAPEAAKADAAVTITEIIADYPIPVKNSGGRGGQTIYDFDKLEIGASFAVVGKNIKGMASTVSSANKRFTEEVKDADGNVVMIDDPKKPGTKKALTKQTRKFICGTVDPADPRNKGATVRVWRVKLDA